MRDITQPVDPSVYAKRLPWFIAARTLLCIGIVVSLVLQISDGAANAFFVTTFVLLFITTAVSLAWEVRQLVRLRRTAGVAETGAE